MLESSQVEKGRKRKALNSNRLKLNVARTTIPYAISDAFIFHRNFPIYRVLGCLLTHHTA